MFCCLPVVYMFWAVCSRERATKTDKKLPVRTYKIGLYTVEKPGKSSYPLPAEKNFERTPLELQCSDRGQTSTTESGRPSCVDVLSVFGNKCSYEEIWSKKDEKITNIRTHSNIHLVILFRDRVVRFKITVQGTAVPPLDSSTIASSAPFLSTISTTGRA